jgi:hypothetical protein
MTKLITVHGTNAGDPSDEGERWWQKNSPFQKRLAEWLDLDGVVIEPFHWDEGPNSEVKRRKAGEGLLKRLKGLEKSGEDYYLIGHSHGGSVIHSALRWASVKGQALPHLRSWLTIGTPFIWTKPRRLLFSRLSRVGKVFYLVAVMSFFQLTAIAFYISLDYMFTPKHSETIDFFLHPLAFVGLGGFVLEVDGFDASALVMFVVYFVLLACSFIWLRHASRVLYSAKTTQFFKANFLIRWRSLRSRHDEAINALHAAERLRLQLFRRSLLVPPLRTLLMLALILFTVWTTIAFSYFFYGTYSGVDRLDLQNALYDGITQDVRYLIDHPLLFLIVIAIAPILLLLNSLILTALMFVVFVVFDWLAYLMGIPISAFLNRLTLVQLQRTTSGNDTVGNEHVVRVAATPESCDPSYGLVSENMEAVLADFSNKKAVETLTAVRQLLGLNQETQDRRDIAKIMAEQMSWHELIHTAYFDVDEFAKLIAYLLHKADLAPLTESFKTDPDFEKIRIAYESLSPLITGTSKEPRTHGVFAYLARKIRMPRLS